MDDFFFYESILDVRRAGNITFITISDSRPYFVLSHVFEYLNCCIHPGLVVFDIHFGLCTIAYSVFFRAYPMRVSLRFFLFLFVMLVFLIIWPYERISNDILRS